MKKATLNLYAAFALTWFCLLSGYFVHNKVRADNKMALYAELGAKQLFSIAEALSITVTK